MLTSLSEARLPAHSVVRSGSTAASWGVIGVLLVILYAGVVRDMAIQWSDDPNYSHGFLVPLVSGYLTWRTRHDLARTRGAGSWLGAWLLAAGLSMLILGVIGAENFLMRASLVIVIAALILLHGGLGLLRATRFPVAFLFFMVPLPFVVFNMVAFPMQSLAAGNAATMLDWLGVPVLRDGNVIALSHVTLGVTEACSGIRSLVSLLALAALWAHEAVPGTVRQIFFVTCAVPIAVFANSLRVVLTGLIGQWFGVQAAVGFFHEFSGWLIFLVAFAALLGVHALLSALGRVSSGDTP